MVLIVLALPGFSGEIVDKVAYLLYAIILPSIVFSGIIGSVIEGFGGDTKNISDQIVSNVRFKDGKDCDSIKGVLVKKELYSRMKSDLKVKLGDTLNESPSKKDILNPDFCSSLWIKDVGTLDEVLELTKLNEHRLSIAIFDKNLKRALNIGRKLNFARIVINTDTLDINPLIPWGGTKKTSSGGVEY